MPVLPRVRRLLDASRTLGPGSLAPALLRWTVRREFVVFARDLSRPDPHDAPDPSLRWTDLSTATAPLVSGIDPAFGERDLARMLGEGQRCRLAWRGGRLVHYRWDATGPAYLPYLHRRYRPQAGDVLTTWLYTAPDQRGRGINRASHADLRAQALARGGRRSLGIVAVWNTPSLRTNDRTGRVRVGTVGYDAIGPWRRPFATGAARLDPDGGVTVPVGASGPALALPVLPG
jgi:hypothetical protein